MIEDAGTVENLIIPGRVERVGVAVPTFAAGTGTFPAVAQPGARVYRGQAVVRDHHILPVIDGKTALGEFLEYNVDKYPPSLLADPEPPIGTWSEAVVVIGSGNYYHFFANHLPALLLMRGMNTPRVRLLMLSDFPASIAPVMADLLPYIAGDKPVDVTIVGNGTYDVADVIFPTRAHIDMPVLLARRIVIPHIFEKTGILNPIGERGPLKLFVRRANAQTGRNLLNPKKVEAWFIARGYTAVDPGTLDFTDQVLLFARATHIAGIEGGAMTNIIFAPYVRQIVMLASPFTRDDRFFQHLVSGYEIPFLPLYGDAVGLTRSADYIMPLAALDALPAEATAS